MSAPPSPGPSRARAVPCELCGQMFFPASLKFHQKSCRTRLEKIIVQCPYCGMETPQASLDAHLRRCRVATAHSNGAGENGPGPVSSRMPDGRVKCQFCGRGFSADRVHQHSQICGRLKQARPRAPDGTATQLPEKVYIASAGDFVPRSGDAALPPEKIPVPVVNGSPRNHGRRAPLSAAAVAAENWRTKHQQFLSAVRNARRASSEDEDGGGSEGDVDIQVFEPPVRKKPQAASPPKAHVPARSASAQLPLADSLPKERAAESPAVSARETRPNQSNQASQSRRNSAASIELQKPAPKSGSGSTSTVGSPLRPKVKAIETEGRDWLPGARVKVKGLQSASHLNGQEAMLLDFDTDASCWLVRLDSGTVKPLRAENMVAVLTTSTPARQSQSPSITSVGSGPTPSEAAQSSHAEPVPSGNGLKAAQKAQSALWPRQTGAAVKGAATFAAGNRAKRAASMEPQRSSRESGGSSSATVLTAKARSAESPHPRTTWRTSGATFQAPARRGAKQADDPLTQCRVTLDAVDLDEAGPPPQSHPMPQPPTPPAISALWSNAGMMPNASLPAQLLSGPRVVQEATPASSPSVPPAQGSWISGAAVSSMSWAGFAAPPAMRPPPPSGTPVNPSTPVTPGPPPLAMRMLGGGMPRMSAARIETSFTTVAASPGAQIRQMPSTPIQYLHRSSVPSPVPSGVGSLTHHALQPVTSGSLQTPPMNPQVQMWATPRAASATAPPGTPLGCLTRRL